jgi:hypothetical protein
MDIANKAQTTFSQSTDIYSIDVDDNRISRKKRLTIKNPDELTESPTSFHETQVTLEDTQSFKKSPGKKKCIFKRREFNSGCFFHSMCQDS